MERNNDILKTKKIIGEAKSTGLKRNILAYPLILKFFCEWEGISLSYNLQNLLTAKLNINDQRTSKSAFSSSISGWKFFSPEISKKDKISEKNVQNPNPNLNQQNKQNSNSKPLLSPQQNQSGYNKYLQCFSSFEHESISRLYTLTIIFPPRYFKDMLAIFLLSHKDIDRGRQ